MGGFEPPLSWSQVTRGLLTPLRPDAGGRRRTRTDLARATTARFAAKLAPLEYRTQIHADEIKKQRIFSINGGEVEERQHLAGI